MAAAKLVLETAVQRAYYLLQGVSEEEALRLIARRTRSAASFRASMIKGLKGVHGSRKRWILKLYLRVSELAHPSTSLHASQGLVVLEEPVLLELFDAVLYLYAVTGVDVGDAASTCLAEKTLRLLRRRGES